MVSLEDEQDASDCRSQRGRGGRTVRRLPDVSCESACAADAVVAELDAACGARILAALASLGRQDQPRVYGEAFPGGKPNAVGARARLLEWNFFRCRGAFALGSSAARFS